MYARVSSFRWGLGTKTQMLVLVWHEYHQSPQSPSITDLGAIAFGHLSIFVFHPWYFSVFPYWHHRPRDNETRLCREAWSVPCRVSTAPDPHPLDGRNNTQWWIPPDAANVLWRCDGEPLLQLSTGALRGDLRSCLSSSQQHRVSWQAFSAETLQGDLRSWCPSWVMSTLPVQEYGQERKRPNS